MNMTLYPKKHGLEEEFAFNNGNFLYSKGSFPCVQVVYSKLQNTRKSLFCFLSSNADIYRKMQDVK